MNTWRTAVLLVRDQRSRTLCSLLLNHQGFRVFEAPSPDQIIALAEAQRADLIVADLTTSERPILQLELTNHLPGTRCLFIQERQSLEVLENTLLATVGVPADSSSKN